MIMKFRLDSDIFEMIENGTKDVEIRLNDEKRQRLHIGDKLIFLKRPELKEKIEAYVVGLDYYKDFKEVVDSYSMDRIFKEGTSKDELLKSFKKFYSDEEIKQYGVVAISFKKNK